MIHHLLQAVEYFNPRSREGSDAVGVLCFSLFEIISIHAPAKGATCSDMDNMTNNIISIHAPAKGATEY